MMKKAKRKMKKAAHPGARRAQVSFFIFNFSLA